MKINIKKEALRSIIISFLGFLFAFVYGLIGNIESIRCLYLLNRLNGLEESEKAVITYISKRSRSPNDTIYFTLENHETVYKESIISILSSELKVGDEIEVVFNNKRACQKFCVNDRISSERNPLFSKLNGELI